MPHRQLTPSLTFTTVRVFGEMRTTSTDSIGGRNTRLETRSCSGQTDPASPTGTRYEYGPLRAIVFNVDLGYTFEIEPATSLYTAYQQALTAAQSGSNPKLAHR